MPKLKSNRSALKRFSKSGSGKIMRNKAFKRHILTHKTRKVKRELGKKAEVFVGDLKRLKRQMPYL